MHPCTHTHHTHSLVCVCQCVVCDKCVHHAVDFKDAHVTRNVFSHFPTMTLRVTNETLRGENHCNQLVDVCDEGDWAIKTID